MNQLQVAEIKKRVSDLKAKLPNSLIIPSILTEDPVLFEKQFEVYSSIFDLIEIDILDNTIIKNQTLAISESFKIAGKYLNKEANKTKLALHLMSSNFDYELIKSNLPLIEQIIVNLELRKNNAECFDSIATLIFSSNRSFKFGVYFPPDVNIYDYKDEINLFDFVQLMSVVPGKQGNAFRAETMDTIPSLKSKGFKIKIDGGISLETINALDSKRLEYLKLVDFVSVGSYFSDVFNIKTT